MRLQPVGMATSVPKQSKSLKINKNNSLNQVPQNSVSFTGRADHVIFYGAEFPDYNKKGGVANVMGYYEKMPGIEAVIAQPYYNARKDYTNKGEYTGLVKPWQFDESCPYKGL